MDALRVGARRRREKGAELVEFALVLPLLLLVMVGIFDFGFMFRNYGVIANAAREGARIGVLAGYSSADVQDRSASYMTAAGLTAGLGATTVAIEPLAVGAGATVSVVRVTVTYPHTFSLLAPIARLFGGSFGSITLRAVSTMRVEGSG
jgi:Flp pilus assembly protein TadG